MSPRKGSRRGSKIRKRVSKKASAKRDVAGAEPVPAGGAAGARVALPAAAVNIEPIATISLDDSDVSRAASGRPRKIRGEFPLPVAAPTADAAEGQSLTNAVQAFLRANADATGLNADDSNLRPLQEVATPIGRVVRFQRLHEGIPVVDASVVVHVDDANRVKQIDLGDTPQVVTPAPAAAAAAGARSVRKLTAKQALKAAQDSLGPQAKFRLKVDEPTQVYVPVGGGLRLAYLVVAPTREPEPHDWRIIVDAYTGEVLEKRDMIVFVNGTGMVFDPNPVVTAGNNTLRDPDATAAACGFGGTARATIDGQRVSRTLTDITLSGGVHRLEGPFVRMRNFGAPNVAPPTEASATGFNYSSGDDRFETVNSTITSTRPSGNSDSRHHHRTQQRDRVRRAR